MILGGCALALLMGTSCRYGGAAHDGGSQMDIEDTARAQSPNAPTVSPGREGVPVVGMFPFEVAYRPPAEPPDSLLAKGWTGRVIYYFLLDQEGRTLRVGIARLDVADANGRDVLNFGSAGVDLERQPLPEGVRRYSPWLHAYARQVRFRRNRAFPMEADSVRITVPVRFRTGSTLEERK